MLDAVLWLADGHGASPHGCVQWSLLALGGEHQVRDVLPVHHAGVLEDHRRLLVSEEDGSVFLLIVGTGEARADCRPVSVMCVRGDATDADTDMRPMLRVRGQCYYPSGSRGRRHWPHRTDFDSGELGLSRQCGLGKPMASFTRRRGARGLQGGSPGHTHYQVKC